ncbi:uracil-DNA glycosylase [Deinococcus sp. D7000]|nr:uracil-DNA glycosylase [Deinococcus sp. D7000]
MTDATTPQQFKSAASNRFVVPGWTNLVEGMPDSVEVQLDLDQADTGREHASLLVEYWATNADMTLQSILPVRAFTTTPEGWCVFVPAQGRVLVRAVDPQPTPPVLVSHWINIDPATPAGTTVNVKVNFPGNAANSTSGKLSLNS